MNKEPFLSTVTSITKETDARSNDKKRMRLILFMPKEILCHIIAFIHFMQERGGHFIFNGLFFPTFFPKAEAFCLIKMFLTGNEAVPKPTFLHFASSKFACNLETFSSTEFAPYLMKFWHILFYLVPIFNG